MNRLLGKSFSSYGATDSKIGYDLLPHDEEIVSGGASQPSEIAGHSVAQVELSSSHISNKTKSTNVTDPGSIAATVFKVPFTSIEVT